MNDRELLELAAKAAGIQIDFTSTNGGGRFNSGFDIAGNAVLDWHNGVKWNPLADDGDALRLAVKAGLTVAPGNGYNQDIVEVYQRSSLFGTSADGAAEKHARDPMAATRRAIVRAAARIGEKIKNR